MKYQLLRNKVTTTDPQEELLIQVDEKNNIIGSISRQEAHTTPGVFYRTVYILVKNDKNEILIQRRSSTKDLYPNCWDISVGGHVNFGKSYLETAVREIREELGLIVEPGDMKLKGEVLVHLSKSNEYFNVFEYTLKPGEKIEVNAEEIGSTGWAKIEDIKKSMADKSRQWYARPEQVVAALY